MTKKHKILIVEDEIIVSASMTITLGRKGYECMAVTSGEEAIDVLADFEPDLILMDIGLGGKIDGISTAGILRQQFKKPIIFITEQKNDSVFQQAMGATPQNYIDKPYTDATLLQAISLALHQPGPDTPIAPPATDLVPQFSLGDRVSDGVFVYSGNEYKKVLFRDILFLEANGMSTIMYCAQDKCYKISLSSNNVIAQLACPAIVRTGRSYFVNIQRIDSIKNDELIVEKKTVPISKDYKADLLSRITKIARKC